MAGMGPHTHLCIFLLLKWLLKVSSFWWYTWKLWGLLTKSKIASQACPRFALRTAVKTHPGSENHKGTEEETDLPKVSERVNDLPRGYYSISNTLSSRTGELFPELCISAPPHPSPTWTRKYFNWKNIADIKKTRRTNPRCMNPSSVSQDTWKTKTAPTVESSSENERDGLPGKDSKEGS